MRFQIAAIKKNMILIFIMGALYMVLEGIWRGWTNISMLLVGGICGFLIGNLNKHPLTYNKMMWEQCLIGTIIVLLIEFTSGMILNVYLKLGIWDYSDVWGNYYGQVCIPYSILWFFLVPMAIYVDDYIRYMLFSEEKPLGFWHNYTDLFLGR